MLGKISPALRLAALYLLISGIWILCSDIVLIKIVGDNAVLLNKIQSLKGLGFVILSSFLLFFIANSFYSDIRNSLVNSQEMLNRYKALTEATKEGIADIDLLKDQAVINEQMRFLLNEKDLLIDNYLKKNSERIHPDDLNRITANFNETLQTKSNIWQADLQYLLYDGKYHDVIISGYIIRDKNNRATRFISALQDVTEIRNIRSAFYEQQISHKQMLGQSIIKAQENERNRWSEELHDNVGQLLTVVKLYMEHISSNRNFSPELFDKTREMVQKALDDIRQLSASIKPPEFSITTLQQSIEQLIGSIKRIRQLDFTLNMEMFNENDISDEQKLMIYRVVQEQLNNILKYADASTVYIGITSNDYKASVDIRDNGKGFDTTSVNSGIGLRNIRSRLQIYNGSLVIHSTPGAGCQLIAEFDI